MQGKTDVLSESDESVGHAAKKLRKSSSSIGKTASRRGTNKDLSDSEHSGNVLSASDSDRQHDKRPGPGSGTAGSSGGKKTTELNRKFLQIPCKCQQDKQDR